ncbi:MAG TPA: iron-sulfur cluster biosynthesis family protein, partial [Candidatus Thalassarchaeaceae archaeon]|nr:iron-sulfur cluster biosynthesis family protein [Candidatus Thalassarchaeaceae archaeon]
MSECDSKGVALPIIAPTEIIEVSIEATDSARKAMVSAIGNEHDSKVIIISVDSGGCSGYLYDMKIISDPGDESYQIVRFDNIRVLIHNEHSTMLNGLILDYND